MESEGKFGGVFLSRQRDGVVQRHSGLLSRTLYWGVGATEGKNRQ